MAVVQPPVTGDAQQDSWALQITRLINSGAIGTGGAGTGVGGGGSGTGPAGTDGFNTATLYLFTRTSTEVAPNSIGEEVTYNYETADFTADAPFDDTDGDAIWYNYVPATDEIAGDYVWVIVINIADIESTEVIAADDWSAIAQLGSPGESASTVIIQAYAEDASLNQVTSWVPPFMGISQVSPNFKNDSAMVIGLIPTIYEGGGEVSAAVHTAATYQWTKNGVNFLQTVPAQTGTGGTERVLLIDETDIREGNFNEVFNISIDY